MKLWVVCSLKLLAGWPVRALILIRARDGLRGPILRGRSIQVEIAPVPLAHSSLFSLSAQSLDSFLKLLNFVRTSHRCCVAYSGLVGRRVHPALIGTDNFFDQLLLPKLVLKLDN